MGPVRRLAGGSQSAWVCRERGSGATDAAQSLITHSLGGIVTCVETQEGRTWHDSNNKTLLTFLLSLSSASKKKHCANCGTDMTLHLCSQQQQQQRWHVFRNVSDMCVCYLFVELLQLRVNTTLVSPLDAPDNSIQVQVHTSCNPTETSVTFQALSQHKGYLLVTSKPDTHELHL